MSLYSSGNVSTIGITCTASYTSAIAFVEFLRENLEGAQWVRLSKILAGITFFAFAITPGGSITLGGTKFEFTDETHPATDGVPVSAGANNNESLDNLGPIVEANKQWTFVVTGDVIVFTTYDENPGDDETYNGITCSCTPSGILGLFGFNPNVVAGQGVTNGGGFRLQSQAHSGPGIILSFFTNGSDGITIKAGVNEISYAWDGLRVANTWSLVCSRYQLFLYVPGSTIGGTLFLASALRATGLLNYANYASGPVNAVLHSGGNRGDLSSIGSFYYLELPTIEYAGAEDGNEAPSLCFPGYGDEIGVGKFNNRLSNRDLVSEEGEGFPYEAALALCTESSGGVATNLRILGYLWDSACYSVYSSMDNGVTVDGKAGVVLLSQDGVNNEVRGSFCLITEN